MIIRLYTNVVRNIDAALSQSEQLKVWRQGKLETADVNYALYSLRYTTPVRDAPLIYLSAGTHGDEPAGIACALWVIDQLVAGDPDFTQYAWLISPCHFRKLKVAKTKIQFVSFLRHLVEAVSAVGLRDKEHCHSP